MMNALATTRTLKVMVVDDEPELVGFVVRALQKISPEIQCDSASNGVTALHKMEVSPPDLVILDLMIPGVNGFRVCKSLRSHPQLRKTKILAITAHNTGEVKSGILNLGADAYLAKPFTIEDLRIKISKLVSLPSAANIPAL